MNLKLYTITIPVPKKPAPFLACEWAQSSKVALKHGLKKAFRVRGIRSFYIDEKEFDTPSTTYAYIMKQNKLEEFVKESSPMK